jgi:hypothetical protein
VLRMMRAQRSIPVAEAPAEEVHRSSDSSMALIPTRGQKGAEGEDGGYRGALRARKARSSAKFSSPGKRQGAKSGCWNSPQAQMGSLNPEAVADVRRLATHLSTYRLELFPRVIPSRRE